MSKRINDTDYLFLSARIRVLELTLLGKDRMERMLEADSDLEAAHVLIECGYPEMPAVNVDTLNAALTAFRDNLYTDLYALAPDPKIIDAFKVKYDYHNVKTLLKAAAVGADPARLLVDVGRWPAAQLAEQVTSGDLAGLPADFVGAVNRAKEILSTTHDPQLADFALDQAYFQEMEQLASDSASPFLQRYVALLIDAANLRSVVRVLRMRKSPDFLRGVLFEGGEVAPRSLIQMAEHGEKLESLYASTPFAAAAEEGQTAIAGGSLTAFERSCDNALMSFLSEAQNVAFGEALLVAYLAARESELTAVRIIMTGRLAGLSADLIRERLRDSYV